jgi:uncharacterized protein DUF4214
VSLRPMCRRAVLPAAVLVVLGTVVMLASPARAADPPAVVVERSRNVEQTNDFLRIFFLPSGVRPTALGAPSALRVFATDSSFFRPSLSVAETIDFPGLVDRAAQDLIALRCVPPPAVEPILATWPKVFEGLAADLGGQYTCPSPVGEAENEVYCLAHGFTDEPSPVASAPVHRALTVGVAMFADAARADVLRRRYGIFPAFSGLGFSVKGSGDGAPMLGADVLRRSVVPEYLLKNVALAAAGCRCISVPPYPGREAAPLDPEQIARQGGLGTCVDVAFLGTRLTRFVTGMYLQVLGREPDPAGLRAWTEFIEADCTTGRGFLSLASAFIDSPEFRGSRALTLPDLAGVFYRAFLGRGPTTTELGAWLAELRTARRGGAAIIIGSAEFDAIVPRTAGAVAALGRRLYTQLLQRAPSEGELSALVDHVLSTGDVEGAVATILTSPEFERRALSTRQYVTILYRALLDRDPDPGGLSAQERLWSERLLETVATGVIGSAEFQALVPQLCLG